MKALDRTRSRARWWEWGKISGTGSEKRFLAGPRGRWKDFWSAVEIFIELIQGFRKLSFVGPCVTVFGSARIPEDHPDYQLTRQVGKLLAQQGFTVMTGGGPGIMEAANRGAKDVPGGCSIGCNITLTFEQNPNPYLDEWIEFKYFMVRKFMLTKYSHGFIAAPGGFGTLDELFGLLTLIQTRKIQNFPVVLLGKAYWEPLRVLIQERLVESKTIDRADSEKIVFTDSPEEAVQYISTLAQNDFGLKLKSAPHPHRFLGESAPKKTSAKSP
ncbi:MAG: TIGR00730 family Rossman fold protein [Bdellovibrionales bacterium]